MQSILPVTERIVNFLVRPVAILQRQIVMLNNRANVKLLIQWSNLPHEDATWEDYHFIKALFPDFVINP